MNADALFAKALASSWDIPGLPPSSCIASAKIGQEVLRRLGVNSKPVPCAIWVGNEEAVDMLDSGLDVDLWPPTAYSVGINPDMQPLIVPGATHNGWNGHLILEGTGWIADYSAGQFARPEKGLWMGPWALREGVEAKVTDDGWQLINRRGTAVIIETRRELAAWRNVPDWRMEVPDEIADTLAAAARETLLTAFAKADSLKEESANDDGQ